MKNGFLFGLGLIALTPLLAFANNSIQFEIRNVSDVIVNQQDVEKASATEDSDTHKWTVVVRLTAIGTKRFAAYTKENIGKKLSIVLDGKVLSAPEIKTEISNGTVMLGAEFSKVEAEGIVQPMTEIQSAQSPAATVRTYRKALNEKNKAVIERSFDPPATDFYLSPESGSAMELCTVKHSGKYRIADIRQWNKKGIKPALKMGDYEVIESCKNNQFHYALRRINSEWKIIAHSAKDAP